jgi:hypothetical protein
MPRPAALLWAPCRLVRTSTPAGPGWIPLEDFARQAAGTRARLACFSGQPGEQAFAASTPPAQAAAAFPDDQCVVVERRPGALMAFALPEALVEECFDRLPDLELLTSYPALLRAALRGPARTGLALLAHEAPDRPWLFAVRGDAVYPARPVDPRDPVGDLRQSMVASDFLPGRDRLLATGGLAAALADAIGPVEPFDVDQALEALGAAADVPAFWSEAHRAREAAARAARTRRWAIGAGGATAAAAALAGAIRWRRSVATAQAEAQAAAERAALEAHARDLARARYPSLVRARQPRWEVLLASLARALPDALTLTRFEVAAVGPWRWRLDARGTAADGPGHPGALAEAVIAALRRDPLWHRATLTWAIGPAGLEFVLGLDTGDAAL